MCHALYLFGPNVSVVEFSDVSLTIQLYRYVEEGLVFKAFKMYVKHMKILQKLKTIRQN